MSGDGMTPAQAAHIDALARARYQKVFAGRPVSPQVIADVRAILAPALRRMTAERQPARRSA